MLDLKIRNKIWVIKIVLYWYNVCIGIENCRFIDLIVGKLC